MTTVLLLIPPEFGDGVAAFVEPLGLLNTSLISGSQYADNVPMDAGLVESTNNTTQSALLNC